MKTNGSSTLAAALVLMAIAATAALYWPGLSGPLLFDDYWNLAPVERWAAGNQSFLETLLPNQDSIVFSRPVAMGSFMLSMWLGGPGTFPLKLGNLILHLLCGLSALWFFRRTLVLDPKLASHARWLAVLLMLFWLFHPLHVSTVLYAVQRMAQLSSLFTLLAVVAFMIGREQLNLGNERRAALLLFAASPFMVCLGLFSKQNAAVAPFLCLVIELTYYRNGLLKHRMLQIYFALFAAFPALAACALLLFSPERILGGYQDLGFTVWERVLSQPRALVDYTSMWFLPRSARMGLYTDDFAASTNLWTPWTTLPSLLLLVALSAIAVRWRERSPSFCAGWFFFLVAHGVESSFLPLELYYEHRNYLPSVGLLLAAAGATSLLVGRTGERYRYLSRIGFSAATAMVLALGFSTYARVLVWQTEDAMTRQGMAHHPNSIRVHLDRLALALRNNDLEDAFRTIDAMERGENPRQRLVGRMDRVAVRCMRGEQVSEADLLHATSEARNMLTVDEVHVALLQEAITRNGACTSISPIAFADSLVSIMDAAKDQAESAPNKSTIRRIAGQLYARGGDWQRAEIQARIGWSAYQTMPLGSVLVRSYVKNNKIEEAEAVLYVLERKVRPFDSVWGNEVTQLRDIVNAGRTAPQP